MSDAQGQSLLDFLDTPVLVGDPEGYVVFANKAFVRELTPDGSSPHGEPLASLFAGGGREAMLAAVAEVCSKGESIKFRIREGGAGYLAIASPIHHEESRVGVVILLTDEPRLDGRLLDFHREIQEPLEETHTCLEELLDATGGRRDDRYRGMVERGSVALDRALKWSEELHGLLCGGTAQAADRANLHPGRVMRDTAERLAPDFERAGVEAKLLIGPRVPEVRGDATMLETALFRLLRLRLAEVRAGGCISMLVREVSEDSHPGVLMTIVDSGPDAGSDPNTADDGTVSDMGNSEHSRMVGEIVSGFGGEIVTVSAQPTGRATTIWLPIAAS